MKNASQAAVRDRVAAYSTYQVEAKRRASVVSVSAGENWRGRASRQKGGERLRFAHDACWRGDRAMRARGGV